MKRAGIVLILVLLMGGAAYAQIEQGDTEVSFLGYFSTIVGEDIEANGYGSGKSGIKALSVAGDAPDISCKELVAIQAKTDKLPPSIKKNTAIPYFFFVMLDATTGNPTAGMTVTAKRKLESASSWTTMAGAITDVGSGVYRIAVQAADTNGSGGAFEFTAPTGKPTVYTFLTEEV